MVYDACLTVCSAACCTMDDLIFDENEPFQERPWIQWESTYEVEAWINSYNRDMQRVIRDPHKASGYGICFHLEAGGEIYLHTSPDGVVLIDVPSEAEWITPLLSAVTGTDAPDSQLWMLPDDKLTQLIMGLNSLIKSTRMVRNHDFGLRRLGNRASKLGR